MLAAGPSLLLGGLLLVPAVEVQEMRGWSLT